MLNSNNSFFSFLRNNSQRFEFVFFITVLLINASVLVSTKYFPTYDGGSHAYNTNILRELLFNKDSVYRPYFEINPEILPNYLGNIILLILDPFVSFATAEKILLALIFVFVPLCFRSIVKKFNGNLYLSYLIFPFIQNNLLHMGFHNYTLGILCCLLTIRCYLNLNNEINIKQILLLFVCFGLAYFSHLFTFIITLIFISVHSLLHLLINYNAIKIFGMLKWIVSRAMNVLIPASLFIFFTASYFLRRPSQGKIDFLPVSELNSFILDLAPLQVFGQAERPNCLVLFFVLFSLFIITLYHRITIYKKGESLLGIFKVNDVFFIIALLFIYLIYTQPDKDGHYGYISIRFVFFMFLFFIFWIATNIISNRIVIPLLIIYLFFSYQLFIQKKEGIAFINTQLKRLDKPMQLIKPNSVVMQAYFANYLWQGTHYVNYMGADKSVVVLDNYEADIGYFPIIWNETKIPHVKFGDTSTENLCFKWKTGGNDRPVVVADYFLCFGESPDDGCYKEIQEVLHNHYTIIYQSLDLRFYKLKGIK